MPRLRKNDVETSNSAANAATSNPADDDARSRRVSLNFAYQREGTFDPQLYPQLDELFPDINMVGREEFQTALQSEDGPALLWRWVCLALKVHRDLEDKHSEDTQMIDVQTEELERRQNRSDALERSNQTIQDELDSIRRDLRVAQQNVESAQITNNVLRQELTTALRSTPSVTPSDQAVSSKRSASIPDPDVFSTGDAEAWESFKIQLHDKLSVNEDHFKNDLARIAYIRTRLSGEALQIALPTSKSPAATPEAVIQALNDRFADPAAERTARQNYTKLYQGQKEFAAFLGLFQKYAAIAQIPESQQIDDLRDKLSPRVQDHIASYHPSSLRELISTLHVTTRNLANGASIRARTENATNRRGGFQQRGGSLGSNLTPSNRSLAAPTTDSQPQSFAGVSKASTPAPTGPSSWGRGCLNCGQDGHQFKGCPYPEQEGFQQRKSEMMSRYAAQRAKVSAVELPTDSGNATPSQKPQGLGE